MSVLKRYKDGIWETVGKMFLPKLSNPPANPVEGDMYLHEYDGGNIPFFGGGSLVAKKILTVAATQVDFAGLDSLVDGDYFLVCHVNMAGTCTVSFTVNDNATVANYYTNTISKTYGTSSVSYEHVNNNTLFGTGSATRSDTSLEARIARHPNGYVRVLSQFNDFPTNSMRSFKRDLTTSFTVTSVQKLSLIASAANGFEAGSVFYLYKQNADTTLISYAPIDLTGRTSDYLLRPGETAVKTVTSLASVPLGVATEEGEYEITYVGAAGNVAVSSNNDLYLLPNNVNQSNISWMVGIGMVAATDSSSSATLDSGWKIGASNRMHMAGAGLIFKVTAALSTYTANKVCQARGMSKKTDNTQQQHFSENIWRDYTTAWTSLGTLTFSFAQSGKLIIRRII